jgi:hypothetical protein
VDPPVLVKAAGIIDRWLRQHPDVPEQLRASLRSRAHLAPDELNGIGSS